MQEMWVQSLGQKDPLEKEMASHSSIFAWEIPGTEEPGELQSTGFQRIGHDLTTKQHTHMSVRAGTHTHRHTHTHTGRFCTTESPRKPIYTPHTHTHTHTHTLKQLHS